MNRLLVLDCAHGDETLSQVRFVLHGSSNATEFNSIMQTGLRFTEGRATVSTNLVHAQDWTVNSEKQAQSLGAGTVAGEPGSVVVCAVPPDFHLGYGVFTTAYIDRQLKKVGGAPLKYAAARKQLAFYMSSDADSSRRHIEQEIASGYTLEQRARFTVEPQYIVGSFDQGAVFNTLVTQLDVAVRSLQPVDFDRLEVAMREVFRPRSTAALVMVPTLIRDIIVGTAESIVISRLRMMRWQGLATLGYSFSEHNQAIEVTKLADSSEQRRRIDEMGRRLASSSLFTAELAWLKTYASKELDLMRVELDGAELEAAAG